MERKINIETLEEIIQSRNIDSLTLDEITKFFSEEKDIASFAPDGFCQMDPRNGDWIVYNSARARRPHDNHAEKATASQAPAARPCLICQGKTTQVVDVANLSQGFTFINKNLYPIFFPEKQDKSPDSKPGLATNVQGFHFLQWTSSFHEKDWHNMPLGDRSIVMNRLAALEKKLLEIPNAHVSIIKNYGHLVGGSLAHGHQQIAVSNIMPNRILQDTAFLEEHEETFSSYLLRNTPPELVIKDYGPAVLVTPYFMRRPYDMTLLIKEPSKSYLHMLNPKEIEAIADGWQDAIRIMITIMPRIGKEIAYNVTTHNGPGAGLYFEFLPYTQEMGGFEHLGLYLCQGNPYQSAQTAKKILEAYDE